MRPDEGSAGLSGCPQSCLAPRQGLPAIATPPKDTAMLEKTFDPATVEPRLYAAWEQSGAFAPTDNPDAEPFSIVIPPPNVTGSLHIGHALNNTLQDVLIRFQRMRGKAAL